MNMNINKNGKSQDDKPLKKSMVTVKQDLKKLIKVEPTNSQVDFYALDTYDLTGPFSQDDISFELCKYNPEARDFEAGFDILYYREHMKQADFSKEFKVFHQFCRT